MNKRRHRSTPAVAALAVGGLLAAGCTADVPDAPEADTAAPSLPTSAPADVASEASASPVPTDSPDEWADALMTMWLNGQGAADFDAM